MKTIWIIDGHTLVDDAVLVRLSCRGEDAPVTLAGHPADRPLIESGTLTIAVRRGDVSRYEVGTTLTLDLSPLVRPTAKPA